MSRKKKKNAGTLDHKSNSSSPLRVSPSGSKNLIPQSPSMAINPKLQSYDPVYENLRRNDPSLDLSTYKRIMADQALEEDLKKRFIIKNGVKYYTHPLIISLYSDHIKSDLATFEMLKRYSNHLSDHHNTLQTVYQILNTLAISIAEELKVSDDQISMYEQSSSILYGILSDFLTRCKSRLEKDNT